METEREKMRANLLRAVSHDLRTPLTSIYGACSTVTENYDSLGKEQALKLLREACEDAQWLNRMVENLLSVTRFDGEQVAVKKTPTVLEELLDAVLPFFGCSFARRDTIVIKPGDSASASLLLVAKGSVKLVTEKFELATVGPGEWFGGEALIEETAGYTAIAEEDTVCLSLNVSCGRGGCA